MPEPGGAGLWTEKHTDFSVLGSMEEKSVRPDGGEAMGRVGTEVSDGTVALERPQHNTACGFRMGFQIFQAQTW